MFFETRRHIPSPLDTHRISTLQRVNSSASFLSHSERFIFGSLCVRCFRIPDRINNGGGGNDRRDACSAIWLQAGRRAEAIYAYTRENVHRFRAKKKEKRKEETSFGGNIGESTEITSSSGEKRLSFYQRLDDGISVTNFSEIELRKYSRSFFARTLNPCFAICNKKEKQKKRKRN